VRLPLFTVDASRLTLLEHPERFYAHLLRLIEKARKRIFLASLYIGKGETDLIQSLDRALHRQPGLRVVILLDGLRSTREGEYDGTPKTESSASLVAGLQARHCERVEIRTFRASGLPHWLEKLVGKRFVEGYGLQHMKLYGNEEEVIVSGANLSNDYFTNRRDRYLALRDRDVCQYAFELLCTAGRYSYSLQSKQDSAGDQWHAPYRLVWDEGERLQMPTPGQATGSKRWKKHMQTSVLQLTSDWYDRTREQHDKVEDTVRIVPLVQMGPMNVRQETECVPIILQAADRTKDSRLDFTTGYFSINPLYANRILNGHFYSNMITAAPKANGFYGSKGISGHLPAAYTWLQHRFWRKLVARGRQERVGIHEWHKAGWTYHAKGIWFYPARHGNPTMTLLGSSNFGIRSATLDLECTFLVDATNSTRIQRRLADEVVELQRDACDAVGKELFARPERRVTLGEKIATWCIQTML
jgi:CDP-diacylglycerol--glycerol-3-phosphate 3-phosphatidyltransferase